MNYELALKLKEVGFPQRAGSYISKEEILTSCPPMDVSDYVYNPSLEELIEGCGEDFLELEFTPDVSMNPWWAHASDKIPHKVGDGKSPSEAVANLWLALHKK